MKIIRKPEGLVMIGEVNNLPYMSNSISKGEKNPIGTCQVYRQYETDTNPDNVYAIVTTKSGVNYTFVSEWENPVFGFGADAQFTITIEVYKKDDSIKFKVLSQWFSFIGGIQPDKLLGYIIPSGDNTDLTDYIRISAFSLRNAFDSLTTCPLINLESPDGGFIACFSTQLNQFVTITQFTDQRRGAPSAMLEISTIGDSITATLSDLTDTVSDLSSESASKFVAR